MWLHSSENTLLINSCYLSHSRDKISEAHFILTKHCFIYAKYCHMNGGAGMFLLLNSESNDQTCLPWLNRFDYNIHKPKPCLTRYTENIHEASSCSSKFLVIFHLFIYIAKMNRADIGLTNNTLLQTAWNQLVPVTVALRFSEGNCFNARWSRVDHTLPKCRGSWMDEWVWRLERAADKPTRRAKMSPSAI